MSEQTTVRVRPSAESLYQRAWDLVPELRARARQAEELRRIPDESIAAIEAAELFQVASPQRYGGWGYGMREFGEICRILAHGCASTSWIYGFYVVHHFAFVLRLQEEGRRVVQGDRPFVRIASSAGFGAAGSGEAVKVDGGYRVTGRWPFASGIMNCDWVHVVSLEPSPDGPKPVMLLLPVAETQLEDVWHWSGMAATGSNTFSVSDAFVPDHLKFELPMDPAEVAAEAAARRARDGGEVDGPLEGFSPLRTFDVVLPGTAVGAAEASLELFKQLVLTRVVAFGQGPQRDHREAWSRFAEAASTVRLAQLLWRENVEVTARLSERGERASVDEAAHLRMGSSRIGRLARDAIAVMLDGAGSSPHHLDNALQRYQRDVDVIKSHSYMHWDGASVTAGSALLGLEPVDYLLVI